MSFINRAAVHIPSICSFLELADFARLSQSCKSGRSLATDERIWKALSRAFGLPNSFWKGGYSAQQAKRNRDSIYCMHAFHATTPIYGLQFDEQLSASRPFTASCPLTIAFREHIKPSVKRLSPDAVRALFIDDFAKCDLELIVACERAQDTALFEHVANFYSQRLREGRKTPQEYLDAMEAFLFLAKHDCFPASLDFLWPIQFFPTRSSLVVDLLKALLENPGFQPTSKTMEGLLSLHPFSPYNRGVAMGLRVRMDPAQLQKAVDLLLSRKIEDLKTNPSLLALACLWESDELMEKLHLAGARCSPRELDLALAQQATPAMISLLLKFGAKKTDDTPRLLASAYREKPVEQSQLWQMIFERGKASLRRSFVKPYIFTFLDLRSMSRLAATDKQLKAVAGSPNLCRFIAPSFALPQEEWNTFSLAEARDNLLLLSRVCAAFRNVRRKDPFLVSAHFRSPAARQILGAAHARQMLPSQFLQIRDLMGVLNGREIQRMVYLEPTTSLAKLVDLSRGTLPADWFHEVVSRDEVPDLALLQRLRTKTGAKALPTRFGPNNIVVRSTLDAVILQQTEQNMVGTLKLALDAGAVATKDALNTLLNRHHKLMRNPLSQYNLLHDAVDFLLTKIGHLTDDPFILGTASLWHDWDLMDKLRAAGAIICKDDSDDNTLDYHLGLQVATPESVKFLLDYEAKPSQKTQELLLENYSSDPMALQQMFELIFTEDKAPVQDPREPPADSKATPPPGVKS